jgi:hypothetical protein
MELEKLVEWVGQSGLHTMLDERSWKALLSGEPWAINKALGFTRLAMAHAAEEAIQICDDRLHNGDVTTGALHENTAIREAIRERFKEK